MRCGRERVVQLILSDLCYSGKDIMKKLCVIFCLIFCFSFTSCNKDDEIYFTDLPAAAQAFLERYFPENRVATASKRSEEPVYEVYLDNGYEIDFYADGRWQSVDSRHAVLPSELIKNLLPSNVIAYISGNFPADEISAVERTSAGYNVELATEPVVTLYFDPLGNVTENIED